MNLASLRLPAISVRMVSQSSRTTSHQKGADYGIIYNNADPNSVIAGEGKTQLVTSSTPLPRHNYFGVDASEMSVEEMAEKFTRESQSGAIPQSKEFQTIQEQLERQFLEDLAPQVLCRTVDLTSKDIEDILALAKTYSPTHLPKAAAAAARSKQVPLKGSYIYVLRDSTPLAKNIENLIAPLKEAGAQVEEIEDAFDESQVDTSEVKVLDDEKGQLEMNQGTADYESEMQALEELRASVLKEAQTKARVNYLLHKVVDIERRHRTRVGYGETHHQDQTGTLFTNRKSSTVNEESSSHTVNRMSLSQGKSKRNTPQGNTTGSDDDTIHDDAISVIDGLSSSPSIPSSPSSSSSPDDTPSHPYLILLAMPGLTADVIPRFRHRLATKLHHLTQEAQTTLANQAKQAMASSSSPSSSTLSPSSPLDSGISEEDLRAEISSRSSEITRIAMRHLGMAPMLVVSSENSKVVHTLALAKTIQDIRGYVYYTD